MTGSSGTRRGRPSPAANDALDFMRTLWALDHALRRVSKAMRSSLGVTGPQRLVIRTVGRFPGLTSGEVAEFLHVDPSSLTGLLSRLEASGLLERTVDAADGRRQILSLTRRGKTFDRERGGTVEAAVVRALATQPRTRLRSAQQVLSAVIAELDRTREGRSGTTPSRSPR